MFSFRIQTEKYSILDLGDKDRTKKAILDDTANQTGRWNESLSLGWDIIRFEQSLDHQLGIRPIHQPMVEGQAPTIVLLMKTGCTRVFSIHRRPVTIRGTGNEW